MAIRLTVFLVGFGLAVLGGVSCIMYLNLLTTGMSLGEYIGFITSRSECYLLAAGFVLMAVSIYYPSK
ncbi:hypothetical protein [Bacillus xiapuensis]|uniref:hypothetical protein n=1 Tax=Bacillus xiapuensis TaxID=2014075 RepID=UPI000C2392EE|nr:hypothetical protein [Bacillus xiapuensis]